MKIQLKKFVIEGLILGALFGLLTSCASTVPGWTKRSDPNIDPKETIAGAWTELRGNDVNFYKNGQYVGGFITKRKKDSEIKKGTWDIIDGNKLKISYQRKDYSLDQQVDIFFQTENQFTALIEKGPLSAQYLFRRKGAVTSAKSQSAKTESSTGKVKTTEAAQKTDDEYTAPSEEELEQVGKKKKPTTRRIHVAYPLLVFPVLGSTRVTSPYGSSEESFETDGFISSGISLGVQLSPGNEYGIGFTYITSPLEGDSELQTTMVDLLLFDDELGFAYGGLGTAKITCSGCFIEESSGLGFQVGYAFAPNYPGIAVSVFYYGGMISSSKSGVTWSTSWHTLAMTVGYDF